MKKAAIITLYGNNNFGNKLQNYAVQETLKKHKLHVENIINIPILNNKKINYIHLLKFYIKGILYKVLYNNRIHDCLEAKESGERQKNFMLFNQYINNTKSFFSFFKLKKFLKYDYFFVGSDQIWNPHFGGLSDFDLVTFSNKKKIALSASFGIDEIPVQYKEKASEALKKFDGISVREEKGKEIAAELTGRKNIEILIDPTMLLTTDEWNKVSKKPKNLKNKRYVLCYFLGILSNEKREEIEAYAKKMNFEIIDISDPTSKYYSCGPSEFIYLESHASMICTDSFHSSVFAILYNIPFIVYNREGKQNNMNSRIITLLNKFQLNNRLYNKNIHDLSYYSNIEYKNTNKILQSERKKYQVYIKRNIK